MIFQHIQPSLRLTSNDDEETIGSRLGGTPGLFGQPTLTHLGDQMVGKFKRNHAELAAKSCEIMRNQCEIMRNPCNVYLAESSMLQHAWPGLNDLHCHEWYDASVMHFRPCIMKRNSEQIFRAITHLDPSQSLRGQTKSSRTKQFSWT